MKYLAILLFVFLFAYALRAFLFGVHIDKSVSKYYFKKEGGIYYARSGSIYAFGGEYRLESVDKKSFEVLGQNIAKDKHHVYYRGDVVPRAKAESTRALWGGYYMDDESIYYGYVRIRENDNSIKWQPVPGDIHGFYLASEDQVYWQGFESIGDIGSLRVLDGSPYSSDINNIYFQGDPFEGGDPDSLEVYKIYKSDSIANNHYATDNSRVYFYDQIVEGADPRTFKLLIAEANSPYFADDSQVYYCLYKKGYSPAHEKHRENPDYLRVVEHADPHSFRKFDNVLYVDKESVFYGGKRIIDSDSQTLTELGYYFHKDINNVYKFGRRITNIDYELFSGEEIPDLSYGGFYGSEEEAIIFIPNEDIKKIDDDYFSYNDKVYIRNSVIYGADINTFEVISSHFSKDINYVYYGRNRVINAKPESFVYNRKMTVDVLENGRAVLNEG